MRDEKYLSHMNMYSVTCQPAENVVKEEWFSKPKNMGHVLLSFKPKKIRINAPTQCRVRIGHIVHKQYGIRNRRNGYIIRILNFFPFRHKQYREKCNRHLLDSKKRRLAEGSAALCTKENDEYNAVGWLVESEHHNDRYKDVTIDVHLLN